MWQKDMTRRDNSGAFDEYLIFVDFHYKQPILMKKCNGSLRVI